MYEYSQPANLLAKSPRKYLLFVPKIAVNPAPRPIVFLFHGTDEYQNKYFITCIYFFDRTCWETELFKQERDDNRAWQRLAQKENFYVVWAESTVAILSPKVLHIAKADCTLNVFGSTRVKYGNQIAMVTFTFICITYMSIMRDHRLPICGVDDPRRVR